MSDRSNLLASCPFVCCVLCFFCCYWRNRGIKFLRYRKSIEFGYNDVMTNTVVSLKKEFFFTEKSALFCLKTEFQLTSVLVSINGSMVWGFP